MMVETDDFEIEQQKKIGIFFAQLRVKAELTQRDIGRLSQVGQAVITKFEKAQVNFKISTLQILARVHGYRLKIYLEPIGGGEDILVEPDPNFDHTRLYRGNSLKKNPTRKKTRKVVKKPEPILEGPQVQYDNDEEFDTEREMAALRAKFGIKS